MKTPRHLPKKPKSDRLLAERNRIRGLIGAVKGRQRGAVRPRQGGFNPTGEEQRFQQGLAAALIKSRQALAVGQFDTFVSWMEGQTSSQLAGSIKSAAAAPELLREVLAAQPLPLAKEIQWVVARLLPHAPGLRRFSDRIEELQRIYWKADWPELDRWLREAKQAHGESLLLIELRICLLQEFQGLESQKAVVAAQRKLGARALPAYIAHHISVRNEPTTDIARYKRDLSARLGALEISGPLRSFLTLRLVGGEPQTELEASQALQVAQSLSDVDLLDMLMRVCGSPIASPLLASRDGAVRAALMRLEPLGDARLHRALTEVDRLSAPVPSHMASVRFRLGALKAQPERLGLAIEIAGMLHSVKRSSATESTSGKPLSRLIRSMAAVLRFDPEQDEDVAQLERFHANHWFIEPASDCWARFQQEIGRDRTTSGAGARSAPLGPSSLLGSLIASVEPPRWAATIQALNETWDAIDDADLGTAIERVVKLALHQCAPLSSLPLKEALASARWKQLRPHRASLSLPIALHLCWLATDSDLAATNLRYAYEEFLDARGMTSPTELAGRQQEFDRAELIYFLSQVCIPAVMDMSRHIDTSQAVDEVRKEVCAALAEVDSDNAAIYQGEIVGIVHSQSLAEGQTIVDSSRVYVDTDAIRAWAGRELAGDLQRYAALVAAGVGVGESLEAILRAIQTVPGHAAYLEVPGSEADDLLVELLMALRRQFLLDPQHGLDSYLSRRVRHHSMTGYLRGPVEEARLITARTAKSGKYAPNHHWLSKLSSDGTRRGAVARAFEQFAEDFDGIVLRLKGGLFHVRSSDHPRGLFDIPVTPAMIHLARSAVQTDISPDTFCSVCFSIFWAALEPSLQEAQRHLRSETKSEVANAFQRLRASLKRDVDRSLYDEASIAIQGASESVQREIEHMAQWFARREAQQTRQLYPMRKVLEISVASALASHRPFDFSIEQVVECNLLVRAGDLVVIAEVVLTALGNVKAHSGRGGDGPVVLSLSNESADTVSLRITNPVRESAVPQRTLERIEAIRDAIAGGTYATRVRSEGGSGLMKIAASVQQSHRGQLDFGLRDGVFFVHATFGFAADAVQAPEGVVGRLLG